MPGRRRTQYRPIKNIDLPPTDSPDFVVRLMTKYDIAGKYRTDAEYLIERLEGAVMQRGAIATEAGSDSDGRRIVRHSVETMIKEARLALASLKAIRASSSIFHQTLGKDNPSGALLSTLFSNHRLNAVDVDPSYYKLASFMKKYSTVLIKIEYHLWMISRIKIDKQAIAGEMETWYLNKCLEALCEFCLSSKMGWGNQGMKEDDVKRFNNMNGLRSKAEVFVADVLTLYGIEFSIGQLYGRWGDTRAAVRQKTQETQAAASVAKG